MINPSSDILFQLQVRHGSELFRVPLHVMAESAAQAIERLHARHAKAYTLGSPRSEIISVLPVPTVSISHGRWV